LRQQQPPASSQESLWDYLRQLDWKADRVGLQSEFRGLCPFHRETHPSFYVNARKNVFYCHGCGRGGGPRHFRQLAGQLLSLSLAPSAVLGHPAAVLQAALTFYQQQLPQHRPAVEYLRQRGLHDPALFPALGIGYAPGGSLRRHLTQLGYGWAQLLAAGLIDACGRDALFRRLVFPCHDADGHLVNLYGRSLGPPPPHRLLPGSKGGLFAWRQLRQASRILLVEGLFDLAALWQHGFVHTTCALGTHLSPAQLSQLCDRPGRPVVLAFDHDANGAGQQAALDCAQQLRRAGLAPALLTLPFGHDPDSYFAAGASAADFARLLEAAS
jgi:DNA primase